MLAALGRLESDSDESIRWMSLEGSRQTSRPDRGCWRPLPDDDSRPSDSEALNAIAHGDGSGREPLRGRRRTRCGRQQPQQLELVRRRGQGRACDGRRGGASVEWAGFRSPSTDGPRPEPDRQPCAQSRHSRCASRRRSFLTVRYTEPGSEPVAAGAAAKEVVVSWLLAVPQTRTLSDRNPMSSSRFRFRFLFRFAPRRGSTPDRTAPASIAASGVGSFIEIVLAPEVTASPPSRSTPSRESAVSAARPARRSRRPWRPGRGCGCRRPGAGSGCSSGSSGCTRRSARTCSRH